MMIGMMTFWLIPAAIVWLLHERSQTSDGGRDSARRILEERYARGEIDADEFETRRMLIDGTAK